MAEAGTLLFSRDDQECDLDDIWDDTALIQAYDIAVSSAKDAIRHRRNASSISESASDSNASTPAVTKIRNPKAEEGHLSIRRKRHAKSKWSVGDHCRSVYTDDGCVYEAEIESMNVRGGTCVVKYVGYRNSEEVSIRNLQPSDGDKARIKQIYDATNQSNAQDSGVQDQTTDVRPKDSHSRQSEPRSRMGQQRRSFPNYAFPRPPNIDSTSQDNTFAPPLMQIPPMLIPPPFPLISDDAEDCEDEALSSMLMSWYMSGYHTGYYQGLKSARSQAKCGRSHSKRKSGDAKHKRDCR